MKKLILFCIILLIFACRQEQNIPQEPLTTYVNPFIGTAEHGHVYPGATVPFGAVQLSPDNGTNGWDWSSGYNYADSIIVGFSHTHLSGTGVGDLADLLVMPTTEAVDLTKKFTSWRETDYASTFSHENESAKPGFYQVMLDNAVRVELTATRHAGMHRYFFPKGAEPKVVLDLSFMINYDRPVDTYIRVENDTLITGYRMSRGWAQDQRVYFAAAFSQPIKSFTLADSTALQQGAVIKGKQARAVFAFDAPTEPILLKIGISSANSEGALASLNEIPNWDFDAVANQAEAAWQEELSKIAVQTSDSTLKTIFYTALYRTALAPVAFSDANGNYKGVDSLVHQADGYTRYCIFSLWDTFRAAHPLYTITQPDKVNDFIKSMLAHYQEFGYLPIWSLLGNETYTMTGYHAIPVIVDAYLKGYRDYDVNLAYEAVIKSAMQDIRGTNFYREYGFIPVDKEGEAVTKTLEYAYDDWCIAQFAKALGKEQDYQTFMQRAASYKPLFDNSTGFMRGKLADGTWLEPFNPKEASAHGSVHAYTEGNAWQHSWFVPQDVAGLIQLMGGNDAFVQKLDQLFVESSDVGPNAPPDVSGLIGQYAHGNEPSHHIAYLYNYAGAPWKTQEKVRQIVETLYTDQPNGLCGNEDCGQMSAWYVFSALGFYPVNPAEGIYAIGSPIFERAQIKVADGKTLIIVAKGVSKENKYIQSAKLNGKPLERSYLLHAELMQGGKLEFEMGNQPNKQNWASKDAVPPSMTK